uniref:Leucine-rich repeat-containing N-terminal plant-type domain-containing protein n=1 Tax=Oryza rufipogon TaxID=4529 RepID=A0A0E0NDH4_ORYRU
MENGGGDASAAAWRFGAANPAMEAARSQSIRALVYRVYACLDRGDARSVAPLGHGDPAAFACFRAAPAATGAVVAAAASGAHNSYAPAAGIAEACSHNSLSGHIPPSLANLTKIVQLEFDQNLLGSSIPDGLSHLPALRMLALSQNSLTGEIPPSFFNMTSLQGLALANNVFCGELPADRRGRAASDVAAESIRAGVGDDERSARPREGGSTGAGRPSRRSRTPTDDGGAWEFLDNLTNCNTLAEIFLNGNMFADVMLSSVVVPSAIGRLATSRSYSSST